MRGECVVAVKAEILAVVRENRHRPRVGSRACRPDWRDSILPHVHLRRRGVRAIGDDAGIDVIPRSRVDVFHLVVIRSRLAGIPRHHEAERLVLVRVAHAGEVLQGERRACRARRHVGGLHVAVPAVWTVRARVRARAIDGPDRRVCRKRRERKSDLARREVHGIHGERSEKARLRRGDGEGEFAPGCERAARRAETRQHVSADLVVHTRRTVHDHGDEVDVEIPGGGIVQLEPVHPESATAFDRRVRVDVETIAVDREERQVAAGGIGPRRRRLHSARGGEVRRDGLCRVVDGYCIVGLHRNGYGRGTLVNAVLSVNSQLAAGLQRCESGFSAGVARAVDRLDAGIGGTIRVEVDFRLHPVVGGRRVARQEPRGLVALDVFEFGVVGTVAHEETVVDAGRDRGGKHVRHRRRVRRDRADVHAVRPLVEVSAAVGGTVRDIDVLRRARRPAERKRDLSRRLVIRGDFDRTRRIRRNHRACRNRRYCYQFSHGHFLSLTQGHLAPNGEYFTPFLVSLSRGVSRSLNCGRICVSHHAF